MAGIWVEAARPRTLTASVAPVLVGTAASGRLIAWRAAAALAVSVALQVAVNYANDYFDGVRGVDTAARVGPRRAVASGLIAPKRMLIAASAALVVAGVAGLALALTVGLELLVVGVLSIAAALGYSGGPSPYASAGLGELFVFLFFGLVATAGSAYVQTGHLIAVAVVSGVPVGLGASAILVVNNLRDIDTDARAGKLTLAVRLGRDRTVRLLVAMLIGMFLALPPIAYLADGAWPLLVAVTAPLAIATVQQLDPEDPIVLIAALGATARFHLVFSLILVGGLWLS